MAPIGKDPIVVATAGTQACAVTIEPEYRQQPHRQRAHRDDAQGGGFGDAKPIDRWQCAVVAREHHAVVAVIDDAGQIYRAVAPGARSASVGTSAPIDTYRPMLRPPRSQRVAAMCAVMARAPAARCAAVS